MNSICVHLPGDEAGRTPDRSYEIACGHGLLAGMGERLRRTGATRAILVADDAVLETHAGRVLDSLRAAGVDAHAVGVPSGESTKSLAQAERLWDRLAALEVDRHTPIVAVGGGVTGDLAGFVAATFARGLPMWHVPTTLVSQVDSAIGGKTGINLKAGKNLVGAFWQPAGVVADIDTLGTLPDREYVSGLAEVVKYGMIFDESFLAWLEENARFLLRREPGALGEAVFRSAGYKARVVEQDEREVSGLRAALNYGHTFAHAYETVAGYGTLLHGEAVAIGMARAARLAARLDRIPEAVVDRQDRLLLALNLPISPALEALRDADALLAVMRRDKKSVHGQLRFVLPSRIGHVALVANVAPDLVRAVLQA